MNDSDTKRDETAAPIVAVAASGRASTAQSGVEAMRCLRESRVRFALVSGDPETLPQQACVDVLVEPAEMEIAAAAVRRAGFREMRRAAARPGTWIFLTYEAERFVAVALHHELRVRGVPCVDAAIALARRDERAALPRLAKEDRFLALLLGAAVEGRTLAEEERTELVRLRRDRLDVGLLAMQTQRLGIQALVEQALPELDVLLREPARWRRFRLRLWGALLRQNEVRRGVWQAWRAVHARLQRGPVLLAIVGPPQAGKTALATNLVTQLRESPIPAQRLTMSCWQGGGFWQRCLRGLAPAAVSLPRLWRSRRGQPVRLTEAEVEFLHATPPGWLALAIGAALQRVQSALFHLLLWSSMRRRYARHIARCRKPLVIADGWILDLAFRGGLSPYQHGARWRSFVFRHFPAPDGIVYISPSYELAASRQPALERAQYDGVDLSLRKLLRPLSPLEFVTDDAPRVVALTFLQRYWAHLLERHNRHA